MSDPHTLPFIQRLLYVCKGGIKTSQKSSQNSAPTEVRKRTTEAILFKRQKRRARVIALITVIQSNCAPRPVV